MELNNALQELNGPNILKYVSEKQIFSNYMDKPVFDKAFSSPFRSDNKPSFIVKSSGPYFKDFATGEFGDCFLFVKKLYNVNFNDALLQIVNDMGLAPHFDLPVKLRQLQTLHKAKVRNVKSKASTGVSDFRVKVRKWRQADFEYWASYGVTRSILLKYGYVQPVSHYFLNGVPIQAENYAYAYLERKDGIPTYKVYQPFSKRNKWIGNNNYSVWELWNIINAFGTDKEAKRDLIITSSRKDALSIISEMSIPAVAFQAESIMPKKQVMEYVKERFANIFLFYDNDINGKENWGQNAAAKLITKFPYLLNIKIDEKWNCKDYSDFVFTHGTDIAYREMSDLIISMKNEN